MIYLSRAALAALLLVPPVAAWASGNHYLLSLGSRAAVLACAAVSLQFLVGLAGVVSFGHAAFLGIGAYTLLILGSMGLDETILSLPTAMLTAGLFGLVTGWFALRTRGVTLIMITLAFGQMVYFVTQSLAAFGGDDGASLDRRPPFFGTSVLDSRLFWHGFVCAMMAALLLLSQYLARSPFGRALRAARENEARTAASGFDIMATRLTAYVLTSAAAGAAGWLLAVQAEFVSPALLDWRNSGELLVMVILGGVTTAEGAACGALLLVLAQEGLSMLTEHGRLIIGPALILVVLGQRARKSVRRAPA
jgi:branched-chain amino acid transport system permease protein